MALSFRRSCLRIGVAVAPDGFTVCGPASRGENVARVDTPEALRERLHAFSVNTKLSLEIAVAVLPGAGHCRLADLPNVSAKELQNLLRSYPGRFFPLRADKVSVGVCGHVIACGYDDLLDAVRRACPRGARLRIVPAEAAWCAAQAANFAIRYADCWHVVLRDGARIAALRRLPAAVASDRLPEMMEISADVLGILSDNADELAARHAPHTRAPVLQNSAGLTEAHNHSVRRARRAALISLVLITTAVWLEAAHSRTTANEIAANRAVLANQVRDAEQRLAALKLLQRAVDRLHALPRQQLPPADVLLHLGEFLPDNAYITEVTLHGDSAQALVASVDAAAAVRALRRSALLRRGVVQGSISRTGGAGEVAPLENITFSISAPVQRARGERKRRG